MSTISTYMGFPISTIGVDTGLSWETNLNSALTAIDSHNHSPGQGQQIKPSGLNINSDLPFGGNNATTIRALRFSAQLSTIPNSGSDVGELYVSGNELYYNDVSGGNQVQMTLNGTVNATSSGISNGSATAAFSTGTLVVKSSSSSFANIDIQSVVLANSGNLINQLTLQAPVLASSYSVTLPAVPASTSFVTMDASGNMGTGTALVGVLTHSNLSSSANIVGGQLSATANILGTQLAAAAAILPSQNDSINTGFYGINTVSSFSTSSTSDALVVTSSVPAASTTARPAFIYFSGAGNVSLSGSITFTCNVANTPGQFATISIYRLNGLTIQFVATYVIGLFATPSSTTTSVTVPASSINTIDLFPNGQAYKIFARVNNASNSVSFTDVDVVTVQV